MKKVLKAIGVLFLICVFALVLIPIAFKDKIKQLVLDEFAKQTTATLYFTDVNLSAFSSFPDLDFGIEDLCPCRAYQSQLFLCIIYRWLFLLFLCIMAS